MATLYNFVRDNHILALIEEAVAKHSRALNLDNLEIISLPPSVATLTDVSKLYLHRNKLKVLPNALTSLTNIDTLTLDYNELTSLPSPLSAFENLTQLNLSHNPLGVLPPEIGDIKHLEVLWLNSTGLKALPPEIGKLVKLDTFGARSNNIKDLPEEMGNLTRLKWLTLAINNITEIPTKLGNLTNLIHLNLSENNITELPPIFENMKQALKFCFLSDNQVTSISPSTLLQLSHLKKLDLKENPVSPEQIIECKVYDYIFLSDEDEWNSVPHFDDSDSEFWEDSLSSSELDLSHSSEEDHIDEMVIARIPDICRYLASGS